jgi:hypothetical protein
VPETRWDAEQEPPGAAARTAQALQEPDAVDAAGTADAALAAVDAAGTADAALAAE